MNILRVAVAGAGGVGMLLAEMLLRRSADYERRYGVRVLLTGVCSSRSGIANEDGLKPDDISSKDGWVSGLNGAPWLDKAHADVLFEAGPSEYVTGEPGLSYMNEALERDMHCIAISKGALVLQGERLFEQARLRDRRVLVSAAGAAGMPIIDFLRYDLAGARVQRVEAVLTGTAAFVLDDMVRSRSSFDDALHKAQTLGIAEANPSFDLDGWDTAAKLVIIAGAVFDRWIEIEQVDRASVRDVTDEQLVEWRAQKVKPALVGVLDISSEGLAASVQLREFASEHPYANASGSEKAAMIETHEYGAYTLIGGASSLEATVAAALKDLDHLISGSR